MVADKTRVGEEGREWLRIGQVWEEGTIFV
jgi:hypothetical protein